MKRGSSLRFMEWPMPQIFASVFSLSMHFLRRVLHGAHYVQVTRAAAQVAGDRLADLLLARVLVALEQRRARHQHSRRAVAALQRVLLGEGFLHRMELAALLEALDGGDDRSEERRVGKEC